MLFPTISLTSPYILFEGYVIEGSFICRGAPAGNRSVLYSLANSFEWQDAAPESILVSCRSCNWICCLHLLLFFLKKCVRNLTVPVCIVRHQHSSVKCFENTLVDGVLGPIFLGRLGQFPQFSTVLALDKAGSDFPQSGNSVSKVSVFFCVWVKAQKSHRKRLGCFFPRFGVHHLLIYTLAKTASQFVDI